MNIGGVMILSILPAWSQGIFILPWNSKNMQDSHMTSYTYQKTCIVKGKTIEWFGCGSLGVGLVIQFILGIFCAKTLVQKSIFSCTVQNLFRGLTACSVKG